MAIGTAARPAPEMAPESPTLIPQAIITDREVFNLGTAMPGVMGSVEGAARARRQAPALVGCIVAFVTILIVVIGAIVAATAQHGGAKHTPAPVHTGPEARSRRSPAHSADSGRPTAPSGPRSPSSGPRSSSS